MKKKAIAVALLFSLVLSIFSINAFAADSKNNDLVEQGFCLDYPTTVSYIAERFACAPDYRLEIYTKTQENRVFLFIKKYETTVVFKIYDKENNCIEYTATDSSYWKPKKLSKVLNGVDKIQKLGDRYEDMLEAEVQLLVISESDVYEDSSKTDQSIKKSLEALREDALNGLDGTVSEMQAYMVEEIVNSSVDTAVGAIEEATKIDPVASFFGSILDLFGGGEEDFSSHIAQIMGKNAANYVNEFTEILYEGLNTLQREKIYSTYNDKYEVNRKILIETIIKLSEGK